MLLLLETFKNNMRQVQSETLPKNSNLCTTMALQNLQQYGCQTGNKLKEKSHDRNSSRNKNETMFGSGYENCPEFGVKI
jgi:hypothetical protein